MKGGCQARSNRERKTWMTSLQRTVILGTQVSGQGVAATQIFVVFNSSIGASNIVVYGIHFKQKRTMIVAIYHFVPQPQRIFSKPRTISLGNDILNPSLPFRERMDGKAIISFHLCRIIEV
jgi:hypothetical protein